jgi:hypothetical protein
MMAGLYALAVIALLAGRPAVRRAVRGSGEAPGHG